MGEEDPDRGVLHIQAALKLKSKMRSQALRQALGLQPWQYHSEVTRNPADAWLYCSKPDSRLVGAVPVTVGECPKYRDKAMPEVEKDALHLEAKEVYLWYIPPG